MFLKILLFTHCPPPDKTLLVSQLRFLVEYGSIAEADVNLPKRMNGVDWLVLVVQIHFTATSVPVPSFPLVNAYKFSPTSIFCPWIWQSAPPESRQSVTRDTSSGNQQKTVVVKSLASNTYKHTFIFHEGLLMLTLHQALHIMQIYINHVHVYWHILYWWRDACLKQNGDYNDHRF